MHRMILLACFGMDTAAGITPEKRYGWLSMVSFFLGGGRRAVDLDVHVLWI